VPCLEREVDGRPRSTSVPASGLSAITQGPEYGGGPGGGRVRTFPTFSPASASWRRASFSPASVQSGTMASPRSACPLMLPQPVQASHPTPASSCQSGTSQKSLIPPPVVPHSSFQVTSANADPATFSIEVPPHAVTQGSDAG